MNLKQSVTEKEKIFWNMMGSMTNALSTMFLLVVVNRICGEAEGGVFSIGHAVGQLMLTIGTFEVRNYQSTDIREKYKFADYLGFRILSCFFMMVVSIIYVMAKGYMFYKAMIAVLLCLYRVVDAFSDVFQGFFQQRERIDISGKMLCLKVMASSIIFVIVICITKNMVIAIVAMDIMSISCCALYDIRITETIEKIRCTFSRISMEGIFRECLPLFIGSFMAMYIINEPKYAIDEFLGLEQQNIFSIVFMPAFVVNLFSLFVFRPMITRLAIEWEEGNGRVFRKLLMQAMGWCLLFTILGIGGAILLGIPVLELMYGIELERYKPVLVIIMLGGGGNALSTVLRYTLTVVREQYKTLWVYVITLSITLIIAPFLVKTYKVFGAGMLYTISMFVMTMISFAILWYKMTKMGIGETIN